MATKSRKITIFSYAFINYIDYFSIYFTVKILFFVFFPIKIAIRSCQSTHPEQLYDDFKFSFDFPEMRQPPADLASPRLASPDVAF